MTTLGRRIYVGPDGQTFFEDEMLTKEIGSIFKVWPGDYWQVTMLDFPYWAGCCPNGFLCNMGSHNVKEHKNGTITVDPSLLVRKGTENEWHGFLEAGTWRQV